MSAIGGLLRFDKKPTHKDNFEGLLNALRPYGPDRSSVVTAGPMALCHLLLRMTPEDYFDRQPEKGSTGALIAADLRLDNREDLLRWVGAKLPDCALWSDARVLLACWEHFGDEIWPKLRGPFAVSIWDPRAKSLSLARDHLGLNVLMWHRGPASFAFASMPSGLFAMGVPRQINEEKLADFLVLNHRDRRATLYKGVFRVAPAHRMRIGLDGSISEHCFWQASSIKRIRGKSDADYADGLREQLDRAVSRQMRSVHPVGALLSGGLDSSSVTALAASARRKQGGRLTTYTGTVHPEFNAAPPVGAYIDPKPYVEAICAAIPNLDPIYVCNHDQDERSEFLRFFVALQGPVRNPTNFIWFLKLLRLARVNGHRVLLGGLYGNQTISWNGWSQTAGHILRGDLLTAFSQYRLFYKLTSYSRSAAFRALCVEPLSHRLTPFWNVREPTWQLHSAVRKEFASATRVNERARAIGHDFEYRLQPDEREMALSGVDYAGDWNAAEKAATGVEVRDPTSDIGVVEYCFGVPPEQYLKEGTDRSLIRRAMWRELPEKVLSNRLLGLQSADWHRTLRSRHSEFVSELQDFRRSELVSRVIDLDRLDRAIASWPETGWDRTDVFMEYGLAFHRGIAAGRFLRWYEGAN